MKDSKKYKKKRTKIWRIIDKKFPHWNFNEKVAYLDGYMDCWEKIKKK